MTPKHDCRTRTAQLPPRTSQLMMTWCYARCNRTQMSKHILATGLRICHEQSAQNKHPYCYPCLICIRIQAPAARKVFVAGLRARDVCALALLYLCAPIPKAPARPTRWAGAPSGLMTTSTLGRPPLAVRPHPLPHLKKGKNLKTGAPYRPGSVNLSAALAAWVALRRCRQSTAAARTHRSPHRRLGRPHPMRPKLPPRTQMQATNFGCGYPTERSPDNRASGARGESGHRAYRTRDEP